jgi:hypothetical protein
VLLAVFAIEIVLTLWDFVVEDGSRLLPPTERVTHTVLAINAGAFIALLAMSAVGGALVLGSVVMSAWGGPKSRVKGMLAFMAIGGVGLAIAGVKPSLPVAIGGSVLLMLVVPIVSGTSQTLWQTKIAPAVQGRVFSTRRMMAQMGTPVAFMAAGPIADNVFEPLLMPDGALADSLGMIWETGPGRGSALLVSCVGVAVIIIAGLGWLTPSIRNIERDIADALPDPEPEPVG